MIENLLLQTSQALIIKIKMIEHNLKVLQKFIYVFTFFVCRNLVCKVTATHLKIVISEIKEDLIQEFQFWG